MDNHTIKIVLDFMNTKAKLKLGKDFDDIALDWVIKYAKSNPLKIEEILLDMDYCLDFYLDNIGADFLFGKNYLEFYVFISERSLYRGTNVRYQIMLLDQKGDFMKTDKEILEQTNKLANKFYEHLGYTERKDFKFYKATHPLEVMCWDMACDAQLILTETDVQGNIEY